MDVAPEAGRTAPPLITRKPINTTKLTLLAALIAGRVACPAQQYTVTGLGTLRSGGLGASSAFAINSTDVIVGSSDTESGPSHAFRLRPGGTMEDLGSINSPSFFSFARAINTAGTITGAGATQSGGFAEGFVHDDGTTLTPLPWLPGGGDCYGQAINAAGTIVGWSNRGTGCGAPTCTGFSGNAVRWDGLVIQALVGLGGYYSVATGINDSGDICGYGSIRDDSATHGFRFPSGGEHGLDLGTLGGTGSQADAINNSGQIVGWAQMPGDTETHAALWADEGAEDLGTLTGKARAEAVAINGSGVIVGYSSGLDGSNPIATLFRPGALPIDLNTLIPPDSGWVLTLAYGIGSSGKIVGVGLTNGFSRAFVLTPSAACPQLTVKLSTQVDLAWSSKSGALYQIQWRSDLAAGNWTDLTTILPGNGSINSFSDPILEGQSQKFYRLVCLSPGGNQAGRWGIPRR